MTKVNKGKHEHAHLDKDPKTHQFVSTYSEETKDAAVQVFLLTGSLTKASKITGVPYRTISKWSTTGWWDEKFQEHKKRHSKRLDHKFSSMLLQIVNQMEDRITNGDEVILKGGAKTRKKLAATDLTRMSDTIWRILALIRGEPTARTENVTVEKKLNTLMDTLEERQKRAKEEREAAKDVSIH